MSSATTTAVFPGPSLRAGAIVTAIPVLFLLFDTTIKLAVIQPVVESLHPIRLPLTQGPPHGAG